MLIDDYRRKLIIKIINESNLRILNYSGISFLRVEQPYRGGSGLNCLGFLNLCFAVLVGRTLNFEGNRKDGFAFGLINSYVGEMLKRLDREDLILTCRKD